MAPKNKAKKGKKQDDDDFWCEHSHEPRPCTQSTSFVREKAGTSVAGNNADQLDDEGTQPVKAPGLSAFAALAEGDGPADEEQEDYGGLMVCLSYIVCRYVMIHKKSSQRLRHHRRRTKRTRRQSEEGVLM